MAICHMISGAVRMSPHVLRKGRPRSPKLSVGAFNSMFVELLPNPTTELEA